MAFKQALYDACPLGGGRQVEKVASPHGDAFVRVLTVREKDQWDVEAAKDGQYRARLLIASCCDEQGEPEFDEFDLARIGGLPSYAVEPVVEAAMRLNRLGSKDAEAVRKN